MGNLATTWLKRPRRRFSICDWDVYNAQMRVQIGID